MDAPVENMLAGYKSRTEGKTLRYFYIICLVFLVLSGFGQMPVFKRYYIADIPGFGWLAKFYITHIIHYLAASALIGILSYQLSVYLLIFRKAYKPDIWSQLRAGLLAGLVMTGNFLVIKNFSSVNFSPEFIIFLDLSHLCMTMLLLFSGLLSIIVKKR
ncbi:hypothetical protein QUF76_00740 [Desulfobacterales bacterium HSG16]|nr:hypothetical protein [Desulfobacterales bacterium HSG16]